MRVTFMKHDKARAKSN